MPATWWRAARRSIRRGCTEVNIFALLLLVAGLGLIAWLTARARAAGFDRAGAKRLHSLPAQHGWYVAMWTVMPALLFLLVWSSVSPGLVTQRVLEHPAAKQLPAFDFERGAILAEAKRVAKGRSPAWGTAESAASSARAGCMDGTSGRVHGHASAAAARGPNLRAWTCLSARPWPGFSRT